MNQYKPFLRALTGERVNPPPVWIMRQAGRYLPEYREVRAKAGDFLSLCYTPELAAEVTLQPIRRFGFDAAIIFADILLVPHALGSDLRFETGTGPLLSTISTCDDVNALNGPDSVHEKLEPVSNALRITKPSLPPNTALIGFAGAPWTTATYMIAGRGVPGQEPARRFLREQPKAFQKLIDVLTEATIEYLTDQINAGADAIKLFDSWAGSLEGTDFENFVTAPAAKIVNELNRRSPNTPVIAFPRRAGKQLQSFAKKVCADCIALDHSNEMSCLDGILPSSTCVQGNLNPSHLVGGGANLVSATRSVLETFSDRPHVFNLGHGITPDAKVENVHVLLKTVRNWERSLS